MDSKKYKALTKEQLSKTKPRSKPLFNMYEESEGNEQE